MTFTLMIYWLKFKKRVGGDSRVSEIVQKQESILIDYLTWIIFNILIYY